MKATLEESGNTFFVNLNAESVQEAALLVRLGMNAAKRAAVIETYAYSDSITTWITVDRVANYDSEVCRKGSK